MNKKMFDVIDLNGKGVAAEMICVFKTTDTNDGYVIYTLNEVDNSGYLKIYVSKLLYENGTHRFISITDDAEWNKVKDVMKRIVRGE